MWTRQYHVFHLEMDRINSNFVFRPRNNDKKELKGISGRERVPFGADQNTYIQNLPLTRRGKVYLLV